MNKRLIFSLCTVLIVLALPAAGLAAPGGRTFWLDDGVPVTAAPGQQGTPRIVATPDGGAIVAWQDCRPKYAVQGDVGCRVFAQRLSPGGFPLWKWSGLALDGRTYDQVGLLLLSDGAGGALAAWNGAQDGDNDVFVQRITADGRLRWSPARPLAAGPGQQNLAALIPTEDGFLLVWEDWPGPPAASVVYTMRFNLSGEAAWSTTAVVIQPLGDLGGAAFAPDGQGGLLALWAETPPSQAAPQPAGGGEMFPNLYAQHISAWGQRLWDQYGVLVSDHPCLQRTAAVASDGQGGLYAAWYDFRQNEHYSDAYLMHLDAAGQRAWADDLPVFADPFYAESIFDLVPDGLGGVIAVGSGTLSEELEVDIFASRIGSNGEFVWGAAPLDLTPFTGQQDFPEAVSDGQGGAFVAWSAAIPGSDLYGTWAQHLSLDGQLLWGAEALLLGQAPLYQGEVALASSLPGTLIAAWQDGRNAGSNGLNLDIYAQRAVE